MAKPWKIPRLDPDERLDVCLKNVLRTRLKEVFSYASAALTKGDAEGVHDMRVAVRRLSSVLSVFTPCFSKDDMKRIRAPLKDLLGVLGTMRDCDIFIASLREYREQTAQSAGAAELDRFIEDEMRARKAARKQLASMLRTLDAVHFRKRFRRVVDKSL